MHGQKQAIDESPKWTFKTGLKCTSEQSYMNMIHMTTNLPEEVKRSRVDPLPEDILARAAGEDVPLQEGQAHAEQAEAWPHGCDVPREGALGLADLHGEGSVEEGDEDLHHVDAAVLDAVQPLVKELESQERD